MESLKSICGDVIIQNIFYYKNNKLKLLKSLLKTKNYDYIEDYQTENILTKEYNDYFKAKQIENFVRELFFEYNNTENFRKLLAKYFGKKCEKFLNNFFFFRLPKKFRGSLFMISRVPFMFCNSSSSSESLNSKSFFVHSSELRRSKLTRAASSMSLCIN